MPQIFRRRANSIARVSILGGVISICFFGWGLYAVYWSPYTTRMNIPLSQPVPFSHQHHVGGLGIDCRYCHTSVEHSKFAGIPPTKTCINCHSQIWTGAPLLEPVRESFRTGKSLVWTRVNDLPDFVYFDHSIHIRS